MSEASSSASSSTGSAAPSFEKSVASTMKSGPAKSPLPCSLPQPCAWSASLWSPKKSISSTGNVTMRRPLTVVTSIVCEYQSFSHSGVMSHSASGSGLAGSLTS